jgi:hypothetical protein
VRAPKAGVAAAYKTAKHERDLTGAELYLGNARALLQIMALALSEKTVQLDEAELAEGVWGVRELVGRGMELLSMGVRR